MNLLSKKDFQDITGASQNVNDSAFNAILRAIRENEVAPYISDELLTAILALDDESTTDTAKQSFAFWRDYVRPYVAWSVYCELAASLGVNWAAHGIIQFTDGANTSQPVSSAQRQTIINQGEKWQRVYLNKMLREFEDLDKTFDSVVYRVNSDDYADSKPATGRINAIGGVRGNYRSIHPNYKSRM